MRPAAAAKSVLPVVLLVLLAYVPAALGGAPRPFYPGETLVFDFYWSVIPTGRGRLQVLPLETLDGVRAYHFRMTTRTNAFADLFYKVRDRFDTWTDVPVSRTLHYRKKQREGPTRRDIEVFFDWRRMQTFYFKSDRPRRRAVLRPGTLDPVAAFFWVRQYSLEAGRTVTRPITDGKKVFIGRVRVVRREKIRVSGKIYDTFLLVPELTHAGGVFEKSPGARVRIWVTADHRRLPVMIKSKVIVGSFRAELVESESVIPGR